LSRPEVTIDWKKADELMLSGCPGTEVAAYFGIHPNTFYRRVEEHYNMSYSDYSSEKKSKGEALIRAQQFAKALGLTEKGDNTLLIWLGKNRLKQKDKEDAIESSDKSITLKVNFDGNTVQVLPQTLPTSDSQSSQ
jgi:hypothetical protein